MWLIILGSKKKNIKTVCVVISTLKCHRVTWFQKENAEAQRYPCNTERKYFLR